MWRNLFEDNKVRYFNFQNCCVAVGWLYYCVWPSQFKGGTSFRITQRVINLWNFTMYSAEQGCFVTCLVKCSELEG